MGNKRKNRFSKRMLKCMKVKRLTEYHRKRREQAEKFGQFSAEDVGELNFDAGFDTVPQVLDIKVEEPEVTCHFDDDYSPAILLDHSYSRIGVKEEPEWNEEYITTSSTEVQIPTSIDNTSDPTKNIKSEDFYQAPQAQPPQDVIDPASSSSDQSRPVIFRAAKRRSQSTMSTVATNTKPEKCVKTQRNGKGVLSMQSDHNYTRPVSLDFDFVKSRNKSRFFVHDAATDTVEQIQNLDLPKVPKKRGPKAKNKYPIPLDNLRRSPRISGTVIIHSQLPVVPPPVPEQQVRFNWKDFVLDADKKSADLIPIADNQLVVTPVSVPIHQTSKPKSREIKHRFNKPTLPPRTLPPGILIPICTSISTNTANAISQPRSRLYPVPLQLGQTGSTTITNTMPTSNLLGAPNYAPALTNSISAVITKIRNDISSDNQFPTFQSKPNPIVVSNKVGDLQRPSYITPTIGGSPPPNSQPDFNMTGLSKALATWVEKSTDLTSNKLIKVQSKDGRFSKIFQVQHISSAQKKPVSGLRVKTQDELNASAVISPILPTKQDDAPQRLIKFVECNRSNVQSGNTRPKSYAPKPSCAAEAAEVTSVKKDKMVMISDNGKTIRKMVVPLTRVFEKVPTFWKTRMGNVPEELPPTSGTTTSNPVDNLAVQDERNLSKDVSGKRIKGVGKSKRKSENDQKSGETTPINQESDIEAAVPSFVVPNLVAKKNRQRRIFTKNSDGSIVIHIEDVDTEKEKTTSNAQRPSGSADEPFDQNPTTETQNQFQDTISECVDNIIQNMLDDNDDFEEVGVLRVDLDESVSNLDGSGKGDAVAKDVEEFEHLDIESFIPANSILVSVPQNVRQHKGDAQDGAEESSQADESNRTTETAESQTSNPAPTTTTSTESNKESEPLTNPPPIEAEGTTALSSSESDNVQSKPSTSKDLNVSKMKRRASKSPTKSPDDLPSTEKKTKKRIIISLANLDDDSTKKTQENVISLSLTPINVKASQAEEPKVEVPPMRREKDIRILEEGEDDEELPVIQIQDVEALLGGSGQNYSSDNDDVVGDDTTDNVTAIIGSKYSQPSVVLHRISQEEIIERSSPPKPKTKQQESPKVKKSLNRENKSPTRIRALRSATDSPDKEPKMEEVDVNFGEADKDDPDHVNPEGSPYRTQKRKYSHQRRSARLSKQLPEINAPILDAENIEIPIAVKIVGENVTAKSEAEIDITSLLFTSNFTYCQMCRLECENLSGHLQAVHFNKREVLSFPKLLEGSDDRKGILKRWYIIANYEAVIEARKNSNKKRICSLCSNKISKQETPVSHYTQCESAKSSYSSVSASPVSADEVNSDLDRLTGELQAEFSPKTWQNLAKSLIISLYLLNGNVSAIDRLSTFDYSVRRPVDIGKDSLLLEMVQGRLNLADFSQLKVMNQTNVVSLPLFLTAKHEEVIDLLVDQRIYYGKATRRYFYLFTDSLNESNTRITYEDALANYAANPVRRDSDQNQVSPSGRRRKRRRIRLTRAKYAAYNRKLALDIKSKLNESSASLENIESEISAVENEAIPMELSPDSVIVEPNKVDENGKVEVSIDVGVREEIATTSVAVETEAVETKIQSKEKGTQLKSMVVSSYKNNDNCRSIYLKTTNKSANKRKSKLLIDVRDLCVCKRCRKYFLKSYYLKHRKRCSAETTAKPSPSRKRKLNPKKSGSEDSKDVKYRGRVSTCPTLQSPAGVKKYFCIFCKQTFTKLNRHLEHKHNDQEEVQEMLKYPKRSREREQILYRLRTKGTFAFNKNSELNGGKIIVSRRPHPTLQRTSTDFLPCPSCGNYFAKKTLYRHSKRCSKKEGLQKDLRRTALALVNKVHPRCNKIMASQIIPRLVDDNVSEAIKNDELLILFGNHLTSKHHTPNIRKGYIRQNLRIAGKLFLAMKALDITIKEFSTAYNPEYCDVVIRSLMEVAGYNAETTSFKLPEIAKKLGRIIKNCGEIWSAECLKAKRLDDREMTVEFLRKFEETYKTNILAKLAPRPSIKNPNNELKKMFQFSQVKMLESAEKLKEDFSCEIWNDLANSLLVHLRLLNNNIMQDGAGLYVSDYLQRHGLDSDEDSASYHNLGLLINFPKNYLKVKLHASSIWLLLSQEFCSAMDVLLENREDAGVPIENVYLFGCPEHKDRYLKIRDAKNYLRIKASCQNQVEPVNEDVESKPDDAAITYAKNLKKAYDYHSNRMLELTAELRAKFTNQMWIELVKCVLTCVQLTNDKTFAEVVQYLLLIDYNQRELNPATGDLTIYNSFADLSEDFFKLRMRGTPITLLLSSAICDALDLLIEKRSSAGIDPENPYVFGCSGNKYNYYRTEGCIGSLPVTDGVDEILKLRSRIINDMIKNGSTGIQLEKLLPESKADLLDNTRRVFQYSQDRMTELKYKLEEKFSLEIWLELIRCLLTYIHLLNNQSPEDVEKLLITHYNQREPLHYKENKTDYHDLNDLNGFPQNYLKAKIDDGFVLLSLNFCKTVDVLLTYRHDAGVHVDNPYVFGCRGNKENYFRAHGIIAQVAAKCGVKRLKYDKAKKIGGKIEMQEQTVDVKDISRAEREILLNNWKIDSIFRSADKMLTPRTKQRDSNVIPRRRWTETEMSCAARNFTNCLTKGYLPSVYQCQQVIADNVELGSRTPEQLKAWVNNQIQKRVKRGILPELSSPTASSSARLPDVTPTVSKRAPRVRWSDVEQDLVRLYFADYLMSSTLPSASECRKVISQHVELEKRTPEQMRAWINNKNKKRNVVQ